MLVKSTTKVFLLGGVREKERGSYLAGKKWRGVREREGVVLRGGGRWGVWGGSVEEKWRVMGQPMWRGIFGF